MPVSIKARLIGQLARLLSLLPYAINQQIGSLLGSIAWISHSKARRVTEHNLQLCFPAKCKVERTRLAKQSLQETGKQFVECAWIWHRPTALTHSMIREIRGENLFLDAMNSPQGTIVVSPHMGNWELSQLPMTRNNRFTYFYRAPRDLALEPLLKTWREHLGGLPATLDGSGIRKGLKELKKGYTVGILPDQEPDFDAGVFAPFFQQPALTMTLLSRLASSSGAQVILTVAERLPAARGWRIHYLKADPGITATDPIEAATAVNRDVERCIAINPAQYLWDYKRFNTQPDGKRRRYPRN